MVRCVIGVDCSTTATKAVVFDAGGAAVAEGRRTFPLSRPQPGWHEQDPDTWRASTVGALADAAAQIDPGDVAAIGLTHQRESFACLDDRGRSIRPAILWLDGRAGPQIREHGTAAVHELSGKPPDVTPAFYKLLWLQENEPQTLRRTAMVTDVHGYLVHALTGHWTTSVASADPLGLVDMTTGGWSQQLLDQVGLTREQVPDLAEPGAVVGVLTDEAARQTGLRAGTPVVAGAGDGQCAGLGADVTVAGRAYLNLGTAMAAGTYSDTYHWDRAFRTMFGPVPGSYTLETLLSGGTYIVSWYVDRFGQIPDLGLGLSPEQVLETAAAQLPRGSDGLMLLPYWNAAQTPYWDPSARGVVLGWQGTHGKAHFYRAALEGIAYELRLQTDGVDAVLGTPVDRFYAMGGGSAARSGPSWSRTSPGAPSPSAGRPRPPLSVRRSSRRPRSTSTARATPRRAGPRSPGSPGSTGSGPPPPPWPGSAARCTPTPTPPSSTTASSASTATCTRSCPGCSPASRTPPAGRADDHGRGPGPAMRRRSDQGVASTTTRS